ncbi:unnamed protein product [Hymenolepis diminuta]|uniref:Uncharacterized protein n=1 Tax=Hymenolepis diminuta TaxID=6216 RepID=A0A0R3SSZ9_HYMDI|nr:unnamed protein product [Hymenolepis diminuta]
MCGYCIKPFQLCPEPSFAASLSQAIAGLSFSSCGFIKMAWMQKTDVTTQDRVEGGAGTAQLKRLGTRLKHARTYSYLPPQQLPLCRCGPMASLLALNGVHR